MQILPPGLTIESVQNKRKLQRFAKLIFLTTRVTDIVDGSYFLKLCNFVKQDV